MNFQAVIGLEIHVEMKTKSKMFSSAPVGFSREANTQVVPLDMAFPGTMPRVNKQAVINAIRVANALHMEIDQEIHFDRKNYFYSDLPKGFQITQQFRPIGKEGYVLIKDSNGNEKKIRVERIHIEEDTCKQLHFPDYSLLDYNRAGVPLIEIVSKPDIADGTEAMRYVEAIRNIVLYSGTSDGKMEEGSLRCDVNISVMPYGSNTFGTKVELKNLNSTKNIQLGIDYEIARQSSSLLSGVPIQQETRRFDEASGKTVMMRLKTDAVDYKYFPEPNIVPIKLSDEFVKDAIDTCPELFDHKMERYLKEGIGETEANIILSSLEMANFFEEALQGAKSPKAIANWLIVEINSYLNKKNIEMKDLPIKPAILTEVANMQEEGLTHKQCSDILSFCLDNPSKSPKEGKEALHIVMQVSDEGAVLEFVTKALDANPQSIEDFKAGKDRAIGFLVGQVMKLSQGKVNPAVVSKLVNEEIRKR